jgi:hypothetical protein
MDVDIVITCRLAVTAVEKIGGVDGGRVEAETISDTSILGCGYNGVRDRNGLLYFSDTVFSVVFTC